MTASVLSVESLDVEFSTRDGSVRAVRDLSFEVHAGEVLGIVGESGSGKTQSVLALLGLLADNARVSGRALFGETDLLALADDALRRIRGAQIAMIFQDPMTSLNPYLTIGRQMSEVLQLHRGLSRRDAWNRCAQLLDAVQITDARGRLSRYPHELSGGMRQRVMIATALLCEPKLLIADEPTTALDVTVQAQILRLIDDLRNEFSTSIIFITHDLGIVAGLCERVLVMQDGVARDYGSADDVFYRPQSDYTRTLIAAVPRLDAHNLGTDVNDVPPATGFDEATTALSLESVTVDFAVPSPKLFGTPQTLRAVNDFSLIVRAGETVGIVGESGCGKSTLARATLRLVKQRSGKVCVLGRDIGQLDAEALRAARRDMQMVFQDPLASLNPRMTIGRIVGEPLETFRPDLSATERAAGVADCLRKVGLEPSMVNRYPHEFSGGQCQRIGIARALICEPALIICDEPVSALDVTVQAQIIKLLMSLQKDMGLALMFIAHDLAVVRQISHRVVVMYLGEAVEIGAVDDLFSNPRHPYTRALIAAAAIPDPRLERAREPALLTGEVPSPLARPAGCAFRSRCRFAAPQCAETAPQLELVGRSSVACHRVGEI